LENHFDNTTCLPISCLTPYHRRQLRLARAEWQGRTDRHRLRWQHRSHGRRRHFDKQLQRTIAVDIRYVLFIIDKFAVAGHFVDEMMS